VENRWQVKLLHQGLRFTVVGVSAFCIDAGLLFVLTEFGGLQYLVSNAISFSTSIVYSYFLSERWVYDTGGKKVGAFRFSVYFGMSLIGLGLNQLLLWSFVDIVGIYYMLSKCIVGPIVGVFNFVTRKLFLEGRFHFHRAYEKDVPVELGAAERRTELPVTESGVENPGNSETRG
jgi:putative flippase GtrA